MKRNTIHEWNNRPIYLVGFMGSGKTYWGRQWAAHLQRKFIDLDEFIEKKEGISVADIFEKHGEEWFRQKEALALRSLLDEKNLCISCGGGTPCFYDNMDFMNETGYTVYLKASPKFLLQNIMKEPEVRPLLKNMNEAEMLYFIEKKMEERRPFYEKAALILNAETLSIDAIKKL